MSQRYSFLYGSIWVALLSLTGCGYTFQGSGSILPPDVRKIQIPMVENRSTESGLSTLITEALRNRFERFGVVTVVEKPSEADAILNIKVLKLEKENSTATSRTDTSLQEVTTLTLAGELRKTDGTLLWRDPGVSSSKIFASAGNAVVTSSAQFAQGGIGAADLGSLDTRELSRGQQTEALAELSDDLASKIYDEAVAPDF